MPIATIVDVDGTMLNGSDPVARVIAFVNERPGIIFVITGRRSSDRDATEAALDAGGLRAHRSYFWPADEDSLSGWKASVAEELLADGYDITLAIDNDDDNLRKYAELGIPTMEPDEIRGASVTSLMETREIPLAGFEFRTVGDLRMFTGYAAVFDSESEPLPFIETIKPGAFSRTLRSKNNIRMYVNHDDTLLLASTRSKTLRLSEDATGLLAEATLPETSYGRDMAVLLEQRIVDSMSFGFSVPPKGDSWSDDGSMRTLNEVRLHEVSVVTGMPAYAATSAQVRKIAQRVNVDVDELADALAGLESGVLSDRQVEMLEGVLARVRPAVEPVAVVDGVPAAPVDVLLAKLELMKAL